MTRAAPYSAAPPVPRASLVSANPARMSDVEGSAQLDTGVSPFGGVAPKP
ncbi:hypothetical protein AB0J83_29245 [Actinoplanes sp. NPDC049596]